MSTPTLAFLAALSSGLSSSAVSIAPVIPDVPAQTYLEQPPATVVAVGDQLGETLTATPWRATAATESATVSFVPTQRADVYVLDIDTACNDIWGEVRIENSRIVPANDVGLMATMMGCSPQLHALDDELYALFASAPEVRWDSATHSGANVVWVVAGTKAVELKRA